MKQRSHNEYFKVVSLGHRKSCPTCHAKLGENEHVWSWGEYVRANWRTVKYFCKECFHKEVVSLLLEHSCSCHCVINLVVRERDVPEWLQFYSYQERSSK